MLARIRSWLLDRLHEAQLLNTPLYEPFRERLTHLERERIKAKKYCEEHNLGLLR